MSEINVLTNEQLNQLITLTAQKTIAEYVKATEKDRLMTLTQIASELGMARQTVARVAKENNLPRHGGKLSLKEVTRIWLSR